MSNVINPFATRYTAETSENMFISLKNLSEITTNFVVEGFFKFENQFGESVCVQTAGINSTKYNVYLPKRYVKHVVEWMEDGELTDKINKGKVTATITTLGYKDTTLYNIRLSIDD